ncbi:hypothetical protein N0V88_002998 [Collariella sp. IMI 366227]|nr:hypothetical protein N0V88_002998 [Collariella sp. IMI 366227]
MGNSSLPSGTSTVVSDFDGYTEAGTVYTDGTYTATTASVLTRQRGPPPLRRVPSSEFGEEDEVVVIEEHSPPPRRRQSRVRSVERVRSTERVRSVERRSSGYRDVDPERFAGGNAPFVEVRRPDTEEIKTVIESLTQGTPEEQHDAIYRYFAPGATFSHPFCRVPSFKKLHLPGVGELDSRALITAIYRW